MRNINIPIAKRQYEPGEEQVFRDNVRRGLENALPKSALFDQGNNQPLFYGQPHAFAQGTNAAFSVAASTLTYLPFPTIVMTHPDLIASGEFKTAYAMDVEVTVNLYHAAPGGPARQAQYTLYLSKYDGASYVGDFIVGATNEEFSVAWNLTATIMFASAGTNFLRARLIHNDTGANLFDLTQSWMSVKQLSGDPQAVAASGRM